MNQIKFIKDEFLKPCPILCTYKGKFEQSLISRDINTATQITLNSRVNEVREISFVIPFTPERKIDVINSLEKLVYFEGIYFIIKEIEITDADTRDLKVSCLEIADSLKGIYCENIVQIGASPETIFNAIVIASKMDIGYKWLGTDVESNVLRHVITESETSVYENLMSLAKIFNGVIEFSYDESGQGYIYLRKNPINNDKFIKKNIEMKSLTITSNTKEIYSRVLPYGKTDDYGIVLDIQEVNGGDSILSDYSWYQSMGIPDSVIIKEPQYNQLLQISDDMYTDANDLLVWAKEQLSLNSKPQWTAEVTLSDLSIYIDEPIEKPTTMMSLKVIDKDIDFIFDCQIVGVERNYDNPVDIKLEISNVIPYSTDTQKTGHAIATLDNITTNDPRDTDGNIVGDGSSTVIAEKVCDLDHVNVVMRNAETKSLITQTSNLISLRVDAINQSYAELKVTSDAIISHVEDISDTATQTYSEIQQTATKIRAVVVQNSESGEWELSKDAFVIAFNGSTNRKAIIDRNEGLFLGNVDTGTYSKIGYDGRLTLYTGGNSKPYHCLNYTNYIEFECNSDYNDYTPMTDSLPSMFDSIPKEQISVSVSIQKFYKEGFYLPYWVGGYGEVTGTTSKIVKLYGMSAWREIIMEDAGATGQWVKDFGSPEDGSIVLRYTVIA